MTQDELKQKVAQAALHYVKDVSIVGVGTGSTVRHFINYLADLKGQIEDLDDKVVEYLVPILLKEAKFYFNYLRDSDRTNLPLFERPVMITNGRKQQLPSYYK